MVEAQFIKEVGADTRDIFEMSWRKFRVLLHSMFEVKRPDIDDGFDWQAALDRATGRQTPDNVREVSIEEFMGMM